MGHLLYIKTNVRRGGFVKNIYMRDISAGDIRYGILGVETNVLYQWKNLVPTHEERLTPIQDLFLENIEAGSVEYVTRIDAEDAMPVENVSLAGIKVSDLRKERFQNRNVRGFRYEDQVSDLSAETGPGE